MLLVLLSAACVATIRAPASALGLFIGLFGIEQWAQISHPVFVRHSVFMNFVIGGMLALGLSVIVYRGRPLLRGYNGVGILVLLLLVYAAVSMSWAPRTDLSMKAYVTAMPYLISGVLLGPLLINKTRDLEDAFKWLIIAGGGACFVLLFFAEWGVRGVLIPGTLNSYGGTGSANPLATAQVAGYVVIASALGGAWKESRFWAIARWVVVAICLAVIVRTGSRGQLIGTVTGCMILWPLTQPKGGIRNALTLAIIALMFALIINLALSQFSDQAARWGGRRFAEEAQGRFHAGFHMVSHWWSASGTAILLGLGNGASSDPRILGAYPHMVPMEVLSEEGVIGVVMLISIIYLASEAGIKTLKALRIDGGARSRVAVVMAMFVASFVLTCKQGSLVSSYDFFFFAILLGRIWKLQRAENSSDSVMKAAIVARGTMAMFSIDRRSSDKARSP